MPQYRRAKIDGGWYFFTVCLRDRRQTHLTDRIDALRQATARTKQRFPFRIPAAVILPDHLHAIWKLPEGDHDFFTRWRLIKSDFSRHMTATPRSVSQVRKGEKGIWQRRFWEHAIRDRDELAAYIAYIHWNPVKHGHVERAEDWPYSSIHAWRRRRVLPETWEPDAAVREMEAEGDDG